MRQSTGNKFGAGAEQFLRCPPERVFDAFVRPELLTQFWLAGASAPLVPGGTAEWTFRIPGAKNTLVLCDLKTLLETGRLVNLVRDKAVLLGG